MASEKDFENALDSVLDTIRTFIFEHAEYGHKSIKEEDLNGDFVHDLLYSMNEAYVYAKEIIEEEEMEESLC